jgi:hypothetical protein
VIFARSGRSTVLFAAVQSTLTLAFAGSALFVALILNNLPGAVLLGILAGTASAFAVRSLRRLRRWPPGRLGFFRDRMVVVQGSTELRAPWDRIEVCGLAAQGDWARTTWPEVKLTDRLTVRLRGEPPLVLRPAAFGLEPTACRDLILRLRDEPSLRERLPEFDSSLDLSARPVMSGELIQPPI